ncbi:hypothetical protein THAOC_05583, partial [Thalassiosira oceanica]
LNIGGEESTASLNLIKALCQSAAATQQELEEDSCGQQQPRHINIGIPGRRAPASPPHLFPPAPPAISRDISSTACPPGTSRGKRTRRRERLYYWVSVGPPGGQRQARAALVRGPCVATSATPDRAAAAGRLGIGGTISNDGARCDGIDSSPRTEIEDARVY